MKKINIFIIICALITQLICLSKINAQSVSNRKNTEVTIHTHIFKNISSNGRYAIGDDLGTETGFVYDLEQDILIYISTSKSSVSAVTNDGIVFGSYLDKPAYFEIDWKTEESVPYSLPLPEIDGQVANIVDITDVTVDGSICIGYASQILGIDIKGVLWDVNAETVQIIEQPTINEGDEIVYYFPTHISDNGNILSGRVGLIIAGTNFSKFEPVIWNREGHFIGYTHDEVFELNPKSGIADLRPSNMSSDGNYIVGQATVWEIDPLNGEDIDVSHPFVFNQQKNELNIIEEINNIDWEGSAFTAVSNDGVYFGYTDLAIGASYVGKAITYLNGKEYLIEDWLKEFYQYNLKLLITGVPVACSADGQTIVGIGYIDNGGMTLCSYIIRLGDIKKCPKPENAYAEVLGNETVSLGWEKPSGEYDSQIKGYNIYKNDIRINETLITDFNFTENISNIGIYCYCIEAIYQDDCSSGKTEPICIEIYAKGSCYTPNEFKGFATQDDDKSIKLQWEYPDFDLRYDNGNPQMSLSNSEGLPIFFANKFTKEDISENGWNNFSMTDISFYVNAIADYELLIYTTTTPHVIEKSDKDLELLYKQKLAEKADFETGGKYSNLYDKFSRFALDESITLNQNYNYYIAIKASNYNSTGVYPAVYDDSRTTSPWKSDLIFFPSTEDEEISAFLSASSRIPGFQGNWNLSSTVMPIREQVTSIVDVPSLFDKTVESYTIFRDGKELATVMTNEYIDNNFDNEGIETSYTYNVVANFKYACTSEPTDDIKITRTSIDENLSSKIEIYPNPVTGEVCFINGDYTEVFITDMQGRIVYHTQNNDGYINVNSLNSGIYFLKIYLNDKFTVKKIIIK